MRTALLIGFGPFPGAPKNPSADLVRALGRRRRPALADWRVVTAVLPTTYSAAAKDLPALLEHHEPHVVLFFGLANHTKFVRIESRAVNSTSSVHPDAERRKLPARQVIPRAPVELAVCAPLRRIEAAIRSTGIAARGSRDAGRYICNAALLTGLDAARRNGRPKQVAFVHIPWPRTLGRLGRPTAIQLTCAGEAALVALTAANKRS